MSRILTPIGNPRLEWGSDVVAETIRALNIPYIALVPGASFRGFHDSLVNYLGNSMPEMVVCLHEEHAVAIAEGYARVTDRPLAVALHANVGLMHATMMIFNAWCSRTPVLILGANGPIDAHKRRPWIDWIHTSRDQASMIRPYIKWDDQPASPEAAVEAVLRAWQIATTRPMGPVYVCLDAGMQETRIEGEVTVPDVSRYAAATPAAAAPADLEHVVEAFGRAHSPLVLMGRGSRSRDDWQRRVAFAEALGAPVLTSIHNAAVFPTEHRLHRLAVGGERPSDREKELVRRADLILSLDWLDLAGYLAACLGGSQTQRPAAATIIHCSLETTIANGWSMDHQALPAADINLLAHSDTVVEQLLDLLVRSGCGSANPLVPAVWPESIPHWTVTVAATVADEGEAMSLETLARTIAAFSATRQVTLARVPIGWPGRTCRFAGPLDFLGKDGGGAVGAGPGHAVGTALALKDSGRTVIAVIGDGDYLMGVAALWTASHMRLPLILVIANNQAYFNDVRHQERVALDRGRSVDNRWVGQTLDDPVPDLVALARAQGFEGEGPARTGDELVAALARAEVVINAGGRYLIDARVVGY